jgi:hypothetical protein
LTVRLSPAIIAIGRAVSACKEAFKLPVSPIDHLEAERPIHPAGRQEPGKAA